MRRGSRPGGDDQDVHRCHGDDDWRDCLRAAYEHSKGLQAEADRLDAKALRYIHPIYLVQVERTGKKTAGERIHPRRERAEVPADTERKNAGNRFRT
uniref:Uncharacterized protein n=1 Tax=Candidatus Kentrum sp. TC TaxID=2126339 RepID=A0A450YXK1_9GAMM|nr:MAG: hypothetical protein BECKTC1821E_GA0114239_10624 [Candidatus Kentron sp. TC]VFK61731.1 MAG: hypothetical protein BECKTC1821F_GA0114240_10624 [Candidatus Kentron sp. TC]